jgi:hypothetical protein
MSRLTLQSEHPPVTFADDTSDLDFEPWPECLEIAAPHTDVEPSGEGILFAVMCLLASATVYAIVMVVRLLA